MTIDQARARRLIAAAAVAALVFRLAFAFLYWTGKPLGTPCATGALTTSAPRVETDPMRYVPVGPTRLASTESAIALPDCDLPASTD